MTDREWNRPAPTGAWVPANKPDPDDPYDVPVYRWDPNAEPLGLGSMFVVNRNRRQAFAYNLRALIRRLWERITRHG